MGLFSSKKETDEEKFQKYYAKGLENLQNHSRTNYVERSTIKFGQISWVLILQAVEFFVEARNLVSLLSHDSLLNSDHDVVLTPEDKFTLYLEMALCYLDLGRAELEEGVTVEDILKKNDYLQKPLLIHLDVESSITDKPSPADLANRTFYNRIKEKLLFLGLYHVDTALRQVSQPTFNALFCKGSILEAMHDMGFPMSPSDPSFYGKESKQIEISLNKNHHEIITFSNLDPLDCFESALELKPDNLQIMYALSVALKKRGRFDDCKNYQDRILEIKPNGYLGKLVKGLHISTDHVCWCGRSHYGLTDNGEKLRYE